MSTETAALDDLVAEIGLTMTAKHVPSSYNPKASREEFHGIKWECAIKSPRGEMTVPFTQGIGHLPRHYAELAQRRPLSKGDLDKVNRVLFTGYNGSRKLTPPSLNDVLGCLCSDADAINETFGDWADNCGYDTDSRKAEAIYSACRETGLNLLRIIGPDRFEALREAVSEAGF